MRLLTIIFLASALLSIFASAAELRVSSPNGKFRLVVSDDGGLRYRVELEGKPLLTESALGLAFGDGITLGPAAKITGFNGDNAVALEVSLDFLGSRSSTWSLREFAASDDSAAPETVVETARELSKAPSLSTRLQGGGGYAAVIFPKQPISLFPCHR